MAAGLTLVAAGAAVKYVALVPFAFVLLWMLLEGPGTWPRRLAAAARHGAVFLGVLAGCYAPMWEGWQTIAYPWSFTAVPRLHASYVEYAFWVGALGGPASAAMAARLWSAVAGLAVAGLTVRWVRGWRVRGADPLAPWETALRVTLVYLLLAKAVFLPWYQLWLLPLLPAVGDRRLWSITAVYVYLGAIYYLLPYLFPYDEVIAVSALAIHGPPLLMMWRAARPTPTEAGHGG